jgi:hypothetical protein
MVRIDLSFHFSIKNRRFSDLQLIGENKFIKIVFNSCQEKRFLASNLWTIEKMLEHAILAAVKMQKEEIIQRHLHFQQRPI